MTIQQARQLIRNAPDYPALLACYRRFIRSLYPQSDYFVQKIAEIEQEPEILLTAHSRVMNAKSSRAKTMRRHADAIFAYTNLPRRPQGYFRGMDGLDLDHIRGL